MKTPHALFSIVVRNVDVILESAESERLQHLPIVVAEQRSHDAQSLNVVQPCQDDVPAANVQSTPLLTFNNHVTEYTVTDVTAAPENAPQFTLFSLYVVLGCKLIFIVVLCLLIRWFKFN